MKKQQGVRASRGSIIFYVMAVVFLLGAVFSIYQAYVLIEFNKTQYPLKLMDIINVYIQGCLPSFAYSFILYGIGVVVNNIHDVKRSLSLCMYDAIETEEQEDEKQTGDEIEELNIEDQDSKSVHLNETLEEKQEELEN